MLGYKIWIIYYNGSIRFMVCVINLKLVIFLVMVFGGIFRFLRG